MMTTNFATVHRLALMGPDHLTAVLMRAFAIGEDVDPFNPRGDQLKSLGPSLEHLLQDLEREITALSATDDAPQPGQSLLCQALERLAAQLVRLIEVGRTDVS